MPLDPMLVGTMLATLFGGLWVVYFLLEMDPEKATEKVGEKFSSWTLGAVGSLSILTGEFTYVASEIIAAIMSTPSMIMAVLGLGAASNAIDISPGMFAIIAIATFLIGRAFQGRR